MFKLHWIMPKRAVDLLVCWKMALAGIVLLIWRVCYQYTFERVEGLPFELTFFLLHSRHDWMAALSGHSFSILGEFLICEKKNGASKRFVIVASFVHGYAFLKINE